MIRKLFVDQAQVLPAVHGRKHNSETSHIHSIFIITNITMSSAMVSVIVVTVITVITNNLDDDNKSPKRERERYVYMIPVRPSPPPSPPNGSSPPPPVVWCGGGLLPSPPCGVVWCGCGLLPPSLWCGVVRVWALAVPPLHPLWRGMGWVVRPACLDLLGVFGKPMLLDRGGTIFVTIVALEQSE